MQTSLPIRSNNIFGQATELSCGAIDLSTVRFTVKKVDTGLQVRDDLLLFLKAYKPKETILNQIEKQNKGHTWSFGGSTDVIVVSENEPLFTDGYKHERTGFNTGCTVLHYEFILKFKTKFRNILIDFFLILNSYCETSTYFHYDIVEMEMRIEIGLNKKECDLIHKICNNNSAKPNWQRRLKNYEPLSSDEKELKEYMLEFYTFLKGFSLADHFAIIHAEQMGYPEQLHLIAFDEIESDFAVQSLSENHGDYPIPPIVEGKYKTITDDNELVEYNNLSIENYITFINYMQDERICKYDETNSSHIAI